MEVQSLRVKGCGGMDKQEMGSSAAVGERVRGPTRQTAQPRSPPGYP